MLPTPPVEAIPAAPLHPERSRYPATKSLDSTSSAAQRVAPVITATLQPDGSLIHEVQQGQAFWSIAIAYDIKINDIIQMNGLSSGSVLSIGQKLRIHGPYTTTPVSSETPTPEPETPTPTITQTPTITPTPTMTSTPTPRPLFEGASGLQNLDRRGLGDRPGCGVRPGTWTDDCRWDAAKK